LGYAAVVQYQAITREARAGPDTAVAKTLGQFARLAALAAVLLAHVALAAVSLALLLLGRTRRPRQAGAPRRVLIVSPFELDGSSGGSKAVMDLKQTLGASFDVSLYVVPKQTRSRTLADLVAAILMQPLQVIPPRCASLMFDRADLAGRARQAEVVIFEFVLTAVALYFGRVHGPAIVIRDHEVLIRKFAMEWRSSRGLDRASWMLRIAICYLVSFAVYSRADRIIALTEADRSAIARFFPHLDGRTDWISAPFEPPAASGRAPRDERECRNLMMVANFFHSPNRDGLLWFIRECAPHLDGGYTLHLCGNDGALNGHDLTCPTLNIVRHGFVDEAELTTLAPIAIAPIVSGGGIRIKNLYLGAMGKALVTTPLGNEGIEFVDGLHAIVSTDPKDMAARINAIARDPDRVARLGAAASEHVRSRFRRDGILEQLTQLITATASETKRVAV
jgi:glycosyltransferase involved in cell wall biosynthesis